MSAGQIAIRCEVFTPLSHDEFRQTLDLTDLDWISELWIARHDADQQNARLANHIFEENALDVPEAFFSDLKPYLGM